MSTLTTYRTAVKLRGYDSVPDATIDAAVQEARRRVITARRWSWLETTSTALSTSANVDNVSLSSIADFGDLDAVSLLDGTVPIPLRWRNRQIIRDLKNDCPETGVPYFWTRVKGTIVFYPTPSRAFTVTVEYIPAPADLAASPTVDVIPDKLQDLVTWAATVPLAFRQRQLGESSAADQFFTKVLLPQHAGQDGVEQRQTSEQVRTGYWGS